MIVIVTTPIVIVGILVTTSFVGAGIFSLYKKLVNN